MLYLSGFKTQDVNKFDDSLSHSISCQNLVENGEQEHQAELKIYDSKEEGAIFSILAWLGAPRPGFKSSKFVREQ